MTTATCFDPLISLFQHAKAKIPARDLPLLEVIEAIRSDEKLAAKIAKIREIRETGGIDAYKASRLDLKLSAVTFAGTFHGGRTGDDLSSRSGVMVCDVDHLTKAEALALCVKLRPDKHTVTAFISPSEEGVKIIARVPIDGTHREAYESARHHYETTYGIEFDPSGKDVNRLCFLSSDPDAPFNPDATPVPKWTPPTPEPKPRRDYTLKGSGGDVTADDPGEDFNQREAHTVPAMLEGAGWQRTDPNRTGDKEWTRPGKLPSAGLSATWDPDRGPHGDFYVFTSETCFPPLAGNDAFGVYTRLFHGGDFDASAKALRAEGYGKPLASSQNAKAPRQARSTAARTVSAAQNTAITAPSMLDEIKRDFPWTVAEMAKRGSERGPIDQQGRGLVCGLFHSDDVTALRDQNGTPHFGYTDTHCTDGSVSLDPVIYSRFGHGDRSRHRAIVHPFLIMTASCAVLRFCRETGGMNLRAILGTRDASTLTAIFADPGPDALALLEPLAGPLGMTLSESDPIPLPGSNGNELLYLA